MKITILLVITLITQGCASYIKVQSVSEVRSITQTKHATTDRLSFCEPSWTLDKYHPEFVISIKGEFGQETFDYLNPLTNYNPITQAGMHRHGDCKLFINKRKVGMISRFNPHNEILPRQIFTLTAYSKNFNEIAKKHLTDEQSEHPQYGTRFLGDLREMPDNSRYVRMRIRTFYATELRRMSSEKFPHNLEDLYIDSYVFRLPITSDRQREARFSKSRYRSNPIMELNSYTRTNTFSKSPEEHKAEVRNFITATKKAGGMPIVDIKALHEFIRDEHPEQYSHWGIKTLKKTLKKMMSNDVKNDNRLDSIIDKIGKSKLRPAFDQFVENSIVCNQFTVLDSSAFGDCWNDEQYECLRARSKWWENAKTAYKNSYCINIPNKNKLAKAINLETTESKSDLLEILNRVTRRSKVDKLAIFLKELPHLNVEWHEIGIDELNAKEDRKKRKELQEFNAIADGITSYIRSGNSYNSSQADLIFQGTNRTLTAISNNALKKQNNQYNSNTALLDSVIQSHEKSRSSSSTYSKSTNQKTNGTTQSLNKISKDCIDSKRTWVTSVNSCYDRDALMRLSCKAKYSGTGQGFGHKSIGTCLVYTSGENYGPGDNYMRYISTTYYSGKILSSVKDVQWEVKPKPIRPHSNTSSGK